jgi:hypothetical protein
MESGRGVTSTIGSPGIGKSGIQSPQDLYLSACMLVSAGSKFLPLSEQSDDIEHVSSALSSSELLSMLNYSLVSSSIYNNIF